MRESEPVRGDEFAICSLRNTSRLVLRNDIFVRRCVKFDGIVTKKEEVEKVIIVVIIVDSMSRSIF